jgi:hypothetical protein
MSRALERLIPPLDTAIEIVIEGILRDIVDRAIGPKPVCSGSCDRRFWARRLVWCLIGRVADGHYRRGDVGDHIRADR